MRPSEDQRAAEAEDRSFEELVGRLEEVVEALEVGGLGLSDSLKLFEEGVRLSQLASTRIDEAERTVEELLSEGEVVPFTEQPADPSDED